MATRSTNTLSEGLASLVQQIASMKMLPDADLDFLASLEATIIDYARTFGAAQAQGMGGQPMVGGPPGAGALPMGSVPSAGAGGPPPGAIPPEAAAMMGTPAPAF